MEKYDLIISDVSSISYVAEKSEWYKGVVCDSGKDGLKNNFGNGCIQLFKTKWSIYTSYYIFM